jgi:hypothetical protein
MTPKTTSDFKLILEPTLYFKCNSSSLSRKFGNIKKKSFSLYFQEQNYINNLCNIKI